MWEANKKNKTFFPHAAEVVDIETGAVHYIKSGSKIAFIEGTITDRSTQKTYNEATEEREVPSDGETVSDRTRGKKSRKRIKSPRLQM